MTIVLISTIFELVNALNNNIIKFLSIISAFPCLLHVSSSLPSVLFNTSDFKKICQ